MNTHHYLPNLQDTLCESSKKTLFATLHKGHRIDWFTANLKVIITQKVHYILYVPSAPSIIKHPLGKLHLLIFHVHLLIELAQKFTATFIPSASFRNRARISHRIIYSSESIIKDFRVVLHPVCITLKFQDIMPFSYNLM